MQARRQLGMKIKEYQAAYSFRRKNEIFNNEIYPLISSKNFRVGKLNANNQLQQRYTAMHGFAYGVIPIFADSYENKQLNKSVPINKVNAGDRIYGRSGRFNDIKQLGKRIRRFVFKIFWPSVRSILDSKDVKTMVKDGNDEDDMIDEFNNRLNRPKANVISGLMADENIHVKTHLSNLGDVDVLKKETDSKGKETIVLKSLTETFESVIRARDNDITSYLDTHYGSMDADDAKQMYEKAIENPNDMNYSTSPWLDVIRIKKVAIKHMNNLFKDRSIFDHVKDKINKEAAKPNGLPTDSYLNIPRHMKECILTDAYYEQVLKDVQQEYKNHDNEEEFKRRCMATATGMSKIAREARKKNKKSKGISNAETKKGDKDDEDASDWTTKKSKKEKKEEKKLEIAAARTAAAKNTQKNGTTGKSGASTHGYVYKGVRNHFATALTTGTLPSLIIKDDPYEYDAVDQQNVPLKNSDGSNKKQTSNRWKSVKGKDFLKCLVDGMIKNDIINEDMDNFKQSKIVEEMMSKMLNQCISGNL